MRNYDAVPHTIVMAGGLYYSSTVDNSVTRLDAEPGKPLWKTFAEASVRIAPTWANGLLYSGADDGYAYCVDAETGDEVWRFRRPLPKARGAKRLLVNNGDFISQWPIRTGITADGGVAYFAASLLPWNESYLCAVDAKTGRAAGEGRFVQRLEGLTFEGPLALSSGLIVAPQRRVPPRLYSRRDSSAVGMITGGGAFAVVAGREILHGPGNKAGWMTRSNAASRERLATHQQARAVVVVDGVTYLLTKRSLVALPAGAEAPAWATPVEDPLSLMAAGQTLSVGGVDEVRAFDCDGGAPLWRHAVNGRVFGLASAGGAMYASSDAGGLMCVTPRGYARKGPREPSVAKTTGENDSADSPQAPLPTPPSIDDPALVSRWVFQQPLGGPSGVRDLTGNHPAPAANGLQVERFAAGEDCGRSIEAWQLDGESSLTISEQDRKLRLPDKEFSVEAWLRVNRPQPWGAVLGYLQDNGNIEHGWLLGYRDDRFCFAVASQAGPGGLTYLTADEAFTPGEWAHLAGVYDGSAMRLYANGRLAAESTAQSGPIDYPGEAVLEIGAYRDANEYDPLVGAVAEVRLWERPLAEAEVTETAAKLAALAPARAEPALGFAPGEDPDPDLSAGQVAVGPWLRFTAPGEALVEWRTISPTRGVVAVTLDGEQRVFRQAGGAATKHAVAIDGLRHQRVYRYQIVDPASGATTASFECDTFFNHTPRTAATNDSNRVLRYATPRGGLCLVLGSADVSLAAELVEHTTMKVAQLAPTVKQATAARVSLAERGLLPHVTVACQERLGGGWITPKCVNLLVHDRPSRKPTAELRRLLAPGGKAVSADGELLAEGLPFAGAGEWTTAYGAADNSAYGGEQLAGANRVDQLATQWLGRPGPRYQSDRQSRKPPPLAAGGRLFLQGLDRIIAQDLYNGSVLWAIEAPFVRRYNIPRDCANWCADNDHLYTAVRDQLWKIDAARGDVTPIAVDTDGLPEGEHDWGYIASEGELLIGSAVKQGTAVGDFFGGQFWFDKTNGPDTHQACSEHLFALAKSTGEVRWRYRGGRVLNASIAVSEGRVLFVETTNAEALADPAGRVATATLWDDLALVALDAQSGSRLYRRELDITPGSVMFNTAAQAGKMAMVSSHPKAFHIVVVDTETGAEVWRGEEPWPGGRTDYGVHLARPAVVGDRLFLRPAMFSMTTGERFDAEFPVGGCGTYACTADALLFSSGSGGKLSLLTTGPDGYTAWDRLRPDCWLSSIPAGGLLLSPEGGGGCSCGNWMETSLGFIPRAHLQ
ncbi:MAG: PQQ-binding-like beta-propeller repeat protein [Planctomycetota bacterium]